MNLASVIVLLVVLAMVVLAIRAMRMGKSQCSCGEFSTQNLVPINKKIPAEARIFKNQKPKFMKPFTCDCFHSHRS